MGVCKQIKKISRRIGTISYWNQKSKLSTWLKKIEEKYSNDLKSAERNQEVVKKKKK